MYKYPISELQIQKYQIDTLSIKESLDILLPRWDLNQDWADVEKWLKRALKLFQEKQSPFISHKPILFRRLAQSLNPSLPIGVHFTTLEIYNTILINYKNEPNLILNDLFYITLGLFPYAQICSNQIKSKIIQIYTDHILPLGTKIAIILNPLISSLLPGLIDNNEIMRKQVFTFFDSLLNLFEIQQITYAVWMSILRNEKCRYGGYFYLSYMIQKKENVLEQTSAFTDDQLESQSQIQEVENSNDPFGQIQNGDLQQQNQFKEDQQILQNQDISKNEDTKILNEQQDQLNLQQNENQDKQFDNNFNSKDSSIQMISMVDKNNEHKNIQQQYNDSQLNQNKQQNINNNEDEDNFNDYFKYESMNNNELDNKLKLAKGYTIKQEKKQDDNSNIQNDLEDDLNLVGQQLSYEYDQNQSDQQIEKDLQQNLEEQFNRKYTSEKINEFQEEIIDQILHKNEEQIEEQIQKTKSLEKEKIQINIEGQNQSDIIQNIIDNQLVNAQSNQQDKQLQQNVEVQLDEQQKLNLQQDEINKQNKDDQMIIEKENKRLDDEKKIQDELKEFQKPYEEFLNFSENLYKKNLFDVQSFNPYIPSKDVWIEAIIDSFLKTDNKLVTKKSLDFLINFCPLQSDFQQFSKREYTIIMQNLLLILAEKDLTFKRRVFLYIFGPEDEDNFNKLPDQYIIEIFLDSIELVLQSKDPEVLIKIFRIFQSLIMEKEIIIQHIINKLDLQIVQAIIFLKENYQDKQLVEEQMNRFFMAIWSYFDYFIECYTSNKSDEIDYKGLQILLNVSLTNINKNQILTRNILLLKGLTRVIIKLLKTDSEIEKKYECLQIITDFIKTIDTQLKIEQDLEDLFLDFLKIFAEYSNKLITQQDQKRMLKTFENGLFFSTWILLRIGKKQLIENWVKGIETFLNQISSEPNFILATIKGIYNLFQNDTDVSNLQIVSETIQSIFNLAIKKAWELLDNVEFQSPAMKLILQLNIQNSNKVNELVNNSLQSNDKSLTINFLRRLVTFWKLAQKLELTNYDRQLERFCVFKLLDFLEDGHPVRRQIAKSWIIDSSEYFQKIIDYLLTTLLQNSKFYYTLDDKIIHYEKFDIDEVFGVYRRLKNLIVNNQARFTEFIKNTALSDQILIHMFENLTQKDIRKNHIYYQIIFLCITRFMRAEVLQVFDQKFKDDNILIKTASCELLEILFNSLANSKKSLNQNYLLEIILKSYFQNVKVKNDIMQIHLLNLLKLLLFDPNKKNLNFQKVFIEKGLLDQVLISLEGASDNYFMTKIIEFIETVVQIFSDYSQEEEIKNVIQKIFDFFYNYCKKLHDDTNPGQYYSKMIVLQSALNLVKKFCSIEDYVLPKKREEESYSLLGAIFGSSSRNKQINKNKKFIKIEEYFAENLQKIFELIIIGWKIIKIDEEQTQSLNIGFYGDNVDEIGPQTQLKKVFIKNEDFCEFSEKIFYKYQKQMFDILLKYWTNIYENVQNDSSINNNDKGSKVVDYLIFLQYDFDYFNKQFKISQFYTDLKNDMKNFNINTFPQQLSQKQSAILTLMFCIIKFQDKKFIENKNERKTSLRKLWTDIMSTLSFFTKNNHPFVLMQVLNIYYLTALKYPLQEIISEYSIYKTLHNHENEQIQQIIEFVCDERTYKIEQVDQLKYQFLFPLPPKFIDIVQQNLEVYEEKLFLKFTDQTFLIYFYKIISLQFLQSLSIPLLNLTYSSDKTHHIAKRVYTMMDLCFRRLSNLTEDKFEIKVNEEIIKLIHQYLNLQRNYLISHLSPLIQKYFDNPYFFRVSQGSLKNLSEIVKWYVLNSKNKVLKSYLEKVKFTSLFKSQNEEQKVRFKSFHRLCFILYSGEKGTFLSKEIVKFLFEQIRDVVQQYYEDTSLLIMMFFCLRILIIKSDEKIFQDMFPLIWPILYNLLLNILQQPAKSQDLNLKLAALKIIELLSLVYYNQFHLDYWNLGFDTHMFITQDLQEQQIHTFVSEYPYIPYLCILIKKNLLIKQINFSNNLSQDYEEIKAKNKEIIVKENFIDSDQQLSDIAYSLLQQISLSFRIRQKVDFEQINEIIFNDFLSLNELKNT